jgi:tetratricopeptide (TPR) repeat protein
MASLNYDSGRLADARIQYQQALKLDPACEICRVRIDRIQGELAAKVQATFDAGMRAYDARQFSQAISAWETVLMLAPDPADPMNARAKESLARAREAAAGR